jgi:hypothetical protein
MCDPRSDRHSLAGRAGEEDRPDVALLASGDELIRLAKVDFNCVPREAAAMVIPTAIPAAIRPYSKDVPPERSFPNRLVILSTETSRRQRLRVGARCSGHEARRRSTFQTRSRPPGVLPGCISPSLTNGGAIGVRLRPNWRIILVPRWHSTASTIRSSR